MDAGTEPHGHVGEPAAPNTAPGARRRRGPIRLVSRTLWKAWDDGILGQSAQAAFWQALSLPPLLLGLLGSIGFVAGWFGPSTVGMVKTEILQFSDTVFTPDVVGQIIQPTVDDILNRGQGAIVSVGFVLSLWAGSSALASLVDAITMAYQQHKVRNPIWQRTFALLLYLVSLLGAVLVLPLLAIGPGVIPRLFPDAVRADVANLVGVFYYPGLGALLVIGLATLYKVTLPRKHPWHRGLPGALLAMVVFLVSSALLRSYISWVTSTGYTYGALATPIAFLLFSFFLALAIVLGAQFNNAILEMWPVHMTRRGRRRWRRREMDRRAARARAESEREAWRRRRGRAGTPRHIAASPADTAREAAAQSPPPRGSDSKISLQSGQTGEPGFADFVTGNTSPHSATTWVPMTALSAILFFRT